MTYTSRNPMPGDELTLGRDNTGQAFRNGRCETQSFFDDGAKMAQLVHGRRCYVVLVRKSGADLDDERSTRGVFREGDS